jgi:lipoyl(octanoyl) transferase
VNDIVNKKVIFTNLGIIDYKQAWDHQTSVFNSIVDIKIKNRGLPAEQQQPTPNHLFFCEHPHVFTLGKSGRKENLLASKELLEEKSAHYYEINRGGDITYHGPGQIVGYPLLDLDNFFTDIHKYLRLLEESVILTLKEYGIQAGRTDGLTGVWLEGSNPARARKICALGVRTSRWVTMHGFALNVNTDLSYFNNIIPCGIADRQVTSLAHELGKTINMSEVQERLLTHISNLFEMKLER